MTWQLWCYVVGAIIVLFALLGFAVEKLLMPKLNDSVKDDLLAPSVLAVPGPGVLTVVSQSDHYSL